MSFVAPLVILTLAWEAFPVHGVQSGDVDFRNEGGKLYIEASRRGDQVRSALPKFLVDLTRILAP